MVSNDKIEKLAKLMEVNAVKFCFSYHFAHNLADVLSDEEYTKVIKVIEKTIKDIEEL